MLSAESERPKEVPTSEVAVVPGDTLWDIADNVDNIDDKREVIDWMQEHNPVLDDGLHVGEKIKVPVDAEDID